jgi:hypothetical protein
VDKETFVFTFIFCNGSDMGGARVRRIVEARRHIGAFLLPQSKVSYVHKGRGRLGVRLG